MGISPQAGFDVFNRLTFFNPLNPFDQLLNGVSLIEGLEADGPGDGPKCPAVVPRRSIGVARHLSRADAPPEPLNDRHYWVLSQLAQEVKLTKHHVMAQYGFSERSAKRTLSALTKRGLIEFCPDPRPGFYKLCNPELLKDFGQHVSPGQNDLGVDDTGERGTGSTATSTGRSGPDRDAGRPSVHRLVGEGRKRHCPGAAELKIRA